MYRFLVSTQFLHRRPPMDLGYIAKVPYGYWRYSRLLPSVLSELLSNTVPIVLQIRGVQLLTSHRCRLECLSHAMRHSWWTYLIDPEHLHGENRGFSLVAGNLHILQQELSSASSKSVPSSILSAMLLSRKGSPHSASQNVSHS